MKQTPAYLASKVIAIVACCFAVAAPASPQDAARLQCPAGYWLYGSLCLNDGTGDVVYASAPEAVGVEPGIGCRSGYWRYGKLCMNSVTGDVEMADEPTRGGAEPSHGRKLE
jgi:hypothetical protein